MADIGPFRGIHYDTASFRDLGGIVSPPYDVIDDRERDALYEASPHNFVRIILNRPEHGDAPSAPHGRAAETLADWLASGVLKEADHPALYVYRQSFVSALTGGRAERVGVFAALRLSPYCDGVVLPHEFTRPKAKADRLELMRATRANTEPIMVLYEDDGLHLLSRVRQAVEGQSPLLSARVGDALHEVWPVEHPEAIGTFVRGVAERRVWIADGHHRYETALTYRDEVAEAGDAWPEADRILVTLIPFEEPGLQVLPTHRMVAGVEAERVEHLVTAPDGPFISTPVANDETLLERIEGMHSSDGAFLSAMGATLNLVRLRDPAIMAAAAPDRSAAWRALDVSIIQTLLLDGLADAEVSYTRFPSEALARARVGRISAAFMVGHPTARDVREVTAAGDRMPAKSTYFHPKLWSGLLMRRLDR